MLRSQRRGLIPLALLAGLAAYVSLPAQAEDEPQLTCDPETTEVAHERHVRCPEPTLRISCGGELFDLEGDTCCRIEEDLPIMAHCGSDGDEVELTCRGDPQSVLIERTSRGLRYTCLSLLETVVDDGEEDGSDEDEAGQEGALPDTLEGADEPESEDSESGGPND